MDEKMIELAYLRNQLASENFSEADKQLIGKIKKDILKSNSPFKEIALNAISNCELDVDKANFKSAAQELQLIHNFPFNIPEIWKADYFYKIELLSYFEQVEDIQRVKKLIYLLAKLQDIFK